MSSYKSNRLDLKKDTFYEDLLRKRNNPALKHFNNGKYSYAKAMEGVSTAVFKVRPHEKHPWSKSFKFGKSIYDNNSHQANFN